MKHSKTSAREKEMVFKYPYVFEDCKSVTKTLFQKTFDPFFPGQREAHFKALT